MARRPQTSSGSGRRYRSSRKERNRWYLASKDAGSTTVGRACTHSTVTAPRTPDSRWAQASSRGTSTRSRGACSAGRRQSPPGGRLTSTKRRPVPDPRDPQPSAVEPPVPLDRHNIASGTPWEAVAGYSRAVRVGQHVFVSGTTASAEDGSLLGGDDPYEQARAVLVKIEAALAQAGASLRDVVRTRIYVSNIDDWGAAARAHGEVFGDIRPANTLVEARLVSGRLVEIEADAIVGAGAAPEQGQPQGHGQAEASDGVPF
ncbi:MAG: RidA family protein [Chloroflexi bacterium]|nr:RidA family protein [Chloroflexota bacterium]